MHLLAKRATCVVKLPPCVRGALWSSSVRSGMVFQQCPPADFQCPGLVGVPAGAQLVGHAAPDVVEGLGGSRDAVGGRHRRGTTGWRKSSYSGAENACVEVADFDEDGRAVRDSQDPTSPALIFTGAEWVEFTTGVCAGEFD